jgi:hypothetical protein
MNPTAAAVAIATAFALGPVLLIAYQQHHRQKRGRKVRGQMRPKRRPSVRYHVLVFRNKRSRGA